MSRNEKIGLGILVALLLVLGGLLAWTFNPAGGKPKPVEESIFVQQRIKNLEKSQP